MEQLRSSSAILLSLVLCLPTAPMPAQEAAAPAAKTPTHSSSRQAYRSNQMLGDERILHALNRFTFGLRPGDLEAVKAEGLDAWFERQLKPSSLDNSDLDARLAQFPAMRWTPEELLFRLPSDAMIRQATDGKVPVPQTGALHAVYVDQMERYAVKKQEKEAKKQLVASSQTGAAMTPNGGMADNGMADNAQATDTKSGSGQSGAGQSGSAQNEQAIEPQSGQMNMMAGASKPEEPAFDQARSARILALPPQQRAAQLVAMKQPELDSFRKSLKPPQKLALVAGMSPQEKEVVGALENPKNLVNSELCEQRLTRDIYSNAQLQEVMTDFWLNHFNVFLHKNDETPYYLVSYERDVIRPLAMGKFEDLLEATAHSPAMLLYLDNSSSMGPDSVAAEKAARNGKNKAHEGLNENYARELMELHTLGVNGGYTQKDVTQVARVFTGWTVDRPARGGGFKFDENRHEPGTKQVLGKKIKEHGEREGRDVLHLLATKPATAQFLSRKLAVRFVSDDPPQSLVDRMAKSYLTSGGDISAMLRAMYHSPEFWAADVYRAKVKTPIEYVVSSARASGAQIDDLKPIVKALEGMGMPLYGSVPPTGYNWQSSTWVSAGALVNRMNFALLLAANKFGGIPDGWAAQSGASVLPETALKTAAATEIPSAEAEEQRLGLRLVAGGVSESTRAAVMQQLQSQGGQAADGSAAPAMATVVNPARAAKELEKQDELLAGLLLGSPEFQRR
jgi:uncharacterized protein (DUF1800 family)